MKRISFIWILLLSIALVPRESMAVIYGTLTGTPSEGTITYVATSNDFATILTEDGYNSALGTDQGYQGGYWILEAGNLDPAPQPGVTTIKIEFAGIDTQSGKFGSDQFVYSNPNESRGNISFTTDDNPAIPSRPMPEVISAGNVRLTWTNASGATYDVYRSTQASGANNGASNGRYQRIATDVTSPYTDTSAPTGAGSLAWYLLIAKAEGKRSGHPPEVVVASGSGNRANVSLVSSGPPTWTYTLTFDSGKATQWSYTGAAITNAAVTGTAANAGWFVLVQTATEVVFSAGVPLASGSLTGFQISGTQGGTGTWKAHDNSGNIDGSLPVTLYSFTAVSNQTSVTLRWRTESEVNNLGFNIYRSEKREGPFIKINQSLIPGAGNSAMPNKYQFSDKNVIKDKTYFYYIEDIDIVGGRNKTKILQVTVGKPPKSLLTKWGELKIAR